MKKIAVIINPIAGIGAMSALKGSDNKENQKIALKMGYKKTSEEKAYLALSQVEGLDNFKIVTPPKEMGENLIKKLGCSFEVVGVEKEQTSREDTIYYAKYFRDIKVDLILFVGGDGTAKDIYTAIGTSIKVLGIPAGVKMYSSCYAISPVIGGRILKDFILNKPYDTEIREILDIDENNLGRVGVSPSIYGYLNVVTTRNGLQGSKVQSNSPIEEIRSLSNFIINSLKKDKLYIIGPGSTTFKIKEKLGGGTLIGVDIILNNEIICKDANEKQIYEITKDYKDISIIVTCIGGQGYIFGRGNRQISPRIIKKIHKNNIIIAVTKDKLASLNLKPMLVDTGDIKLDEYLKGYYKVNFSKMESTFYKVDYIL